MIEGLRDLGKTVFLTTHYMDEAENLPTGWRRRRIGIALTTAAIDWARQPDLHKLSLSVFAHDEPAMDLYRKFGFVEEGRRLCHYRRQSEIWDGVDMGLAL